MLGRAHPLLLAAGALALVSCGAARPSVAELRGEPALDPLPGEVELLRFSSPPRRARVGVAGRDGAVERVVALVDPPATVADLLEHRDGARYGFRRTELGGVTPNTVELRGRSSAGVVVIATASTQRPLPLFAGLGALRPTPPDRPTTLVVTVISRQ